MNSEKGYETDQELKKEGNKSGDKQVVSVILMFLCKILQMFMVRGHVAFSLLVCFLV